MWGHFANVKDAFGNAVNKVKEIANELENQMDEAVGAEGNYGDDIDIDGGYSVAVPAVTTPLYDDSTIKNDKVEIGNSSAIQSSSSSKSNSSNLNNKKAFSSSPSSSSSSLLSSSDNLRNLKEMSDRIIELENENAKLTTTSRHNMNELEKLKSSSFQETEKLRSDLNKYEENELRQQEVILKLETSLSNEKQNANDKIKELEMTKSDRDSLKQELQNLSESLKAIKLEQQQREKGSNKGKGKVKGKGGKDITPEPSPGPDPELIRLKGEVEQLQKELSGTKILQDERLQEIKSLNVNILELKAEVNNKTNSMTKLQESKEEIQSNLTTAQRESASLRQKVNDLETTVRDAERRIGEKEGELSVKDDMLRDAQTGAADRTELAKKLVRYKEQLEDKQKLVAGIEAEAQVLAKKQSDMEKAVRKAKAEGKEKDKEIEKLKERVSQMTQTVSELQGVIRSNESKASDTSKSLSAMQAVSQASTEKMGKLEAEVKSKSDELSSQKKALESAWAEVSELKRTSVELRVERDDLLNRIGEGTSKAQETENSRRDGEQREAVLVATNKQLEESLRRQMSDASTREERLRDEVYDIRRKWQDAVAARESLASELSEATTPLLRQVATLQDTLRVRTEGWQQMESSLSERAIRSETSLNKMNEELSKAQRSEEKNVRELQKLNEELQSLRTNATTLEKEKAASNEREEKVTAQLAEVKSQLQLEEAERISQIATIRELETRSATQELQVAETERARVEAENNARNAIKELSEMKTQLQPLSTNTSGQDPNSNPNNASSSDTIPSYGSSSRRAGDKDIKSSSSSISLPERLPSGQPSFAALERKHLRNEKHEDTQRMQLDLIKQLELTRDSLLEEVNLLSVRNAELEEQAGQSHSMQQRLNDALKKVNLLLEIVGEKEEQLELTIEDMKDMRSLYKDYISDVVETKQEVPEDTNE